MPSGRDANTGVGVAQNLPIFAKDNLELAVKGISGGVSTEMQGICEGIRRCVTSEICANCAIGCAKK
jgi:hypothetical protein